MGNRYYCDRVFLLLSTNIFNLIEALLAVFFSAFLLGKVSRYTM